MLLYTGARACPGEHLARIELLSLISCIVGKFELSFPDPKSEIEPTRGIIWRVAGDLPLKTEVFK
jgi:cytochrome P450